MHFIFRLLGPLMLVLALGGVRYAVANETVCDMACCAPVETASCCKEAPAEVQPECPCEVRDLQQAQIESAPAIPAPATPEVAVLDDLPAVAPATRLPLHATDRRASLDCPRGPPRDSPARAPPAF